MRTLIIDNYDSFTYNLCHLVGAVTGVAPVVVRNDEDVDVHEYSHVIISPGPGRPERRGDFGICAEVIRTARVPLLGVCLGHQGICHGHGGEVGPAPRVRHGEISAIHHDGTGLFAGLPSPFDAVRYHSLIATRLPEDLEPIATADDGVLMAVRHRSLPRWGVQFHPESIRTEHGHRLVANFLQRPLVTANRRPDDRSLSGSADLLSDRSSVRQKFCATTIHRRRVETGADPETVFDALYKDASHAFWLDSGGRGRFDIMGAASRVATADVVAGTVTISRSGRADEVVNSGFFDWLDGELAANPVTRDLPCDFALGWVGYLGYELKAECGSPNAHRSPHPDAALLFADRAIVFDHEAHDVHLLALDDDGWLDATAETLRTLDHSLPEPPAPELGPLRPRHDRAAYLDRIKVCQEEITAGETYEVCLTNQLTADGALDPWPAYRRLRRANPEPYSAFLRLGRLSVLSASPERFLKVADGIAESRPVKGTRGRGATPAEDAALKHDLATAAKDRAENLMIVDLVRNDLGSVAELDGVRVERLFDIETIATVHQLVSTVRARLAPGRTAVEAVRATFPGGSMTGAPKLRTMSIIDRLEGGPRGVYSGALGYFSLTGAADLAMVIRTIVAGPDRVSYGTGGAIIALSTPDAEVAETEVKATPLLRLLGQEFPKEGPR